MNVPVVSTTVRANIRLPRSVTHPLHARRGRIHDQIGHRVLKERETLLLLEGPLCERRVRLLVRLRPRRLHGRAPARVEHAELDHRGIDELAHLAAQRVDLAHEVSLGNPADGGIAGHLADAVEVLRDQQGGETQPREREGCLDAGMARRR